LPASTGGDARPIHAKRRRSRTAPFSVMDDREHLIDLIYEGVTRRGA
jgi:hypothetical protein